MCSPLFVLLRPAEPVPDGESMLLHVSYVWIYTYVNTVCNLYNYMCSKHHTHTYTHGHARTHTEQIWGRNLPQILELKHYLST